MKAWNLSRAQAGLPELVPFQLQNAAESSLDILSTETAKDYEKTFPRVAVGGTFDHLHAGHKILLTMTALIATESMVVGVTGIQQKDDFYDIRPPLHSLHAL